MDAGERKREKVSRGLRKIEVYGARRACTWTALFWLLCGALLRLVCGCEVDLTWLLREAGLIDVVKVDRLLQRFGVELLLRLVPCPPWLRERCVGLFHYRLRSTASLVSSDAACVTVVRLVQE